MRYLVTKEIKSETQVFWKLYFRDFVFLILWIGTSRFLESAVHTYLQNSFFDILYRNGRNFGVAKQPKPKTEPVSKCCTLFNADKENVLFTSEKKGEENG